MARINDHESLYKAYQDFAQSCLIDDRSLLWPDRFFWTQANVSAVKSALVDAPYWGKESFEEKLVAQLAGLSADVWGMMADAYYLYSLVPVPKILKEETKHAVIASLANKGHLTVPDRQDPIWRAIAPGFCHPGQRYMQKYRQFWLVFVFAEQVKRSSDRQMLLGDRQALQNMLDTCLEMIPASADRGFDMRHALLYLAFPDYYERIVSTGSKKAIIACLGDRLSGDVPADIDNAIYQIRQVLERDETIPKPMDFFQPQIRSIWQDAVQVPQTTQQVQENSSAYTTPIMNPELLNLFSFTKNVILYGPPGTGKTYIANQLANYLVQKQLNTPVSKAVQMQNTAEANTIYDLLALGMYLGGKDKRYQVQEILEFPIIQARFIARPVNSPKESIWGYLQNHADPASTTVKVLNRTEPYLFDKGTDSHWYLTPLGQEYVKKDLAEILSDLAQPSQETSKADDFITRVAFHQSYAYEDFIEGFRPVDGNEIAVVPGKFREVCAQAASNPAANYVLIIDEINRGNISKIFGELITLLEDDKRAGQPASFPVELAYSHMKFVVPSNLYIIGTMNTADRSIALLDVALRRRFAFYELVPDPELLHGKLIQSDDNDQVDLEKMLFGLNDRIRKELGADYQIGHSYLMKVNSLASLGFAWNNQILPLLQEYFYNQPERLQNLLEPYLKGMENGSDLRREGSDLVIALNEFVKG
jgi:hypothetical protein